MKRTLSLLTFLLFCFAALGQKVTVELPLVKNANCRLVGWNDFRDTTLVESFHLDSLGKGNFKTDYKGLAIIVIHPGQNQQVLPIYLDGKDFNYFFDMVNEKGVCKANKETENFYTISENSYYTKTAKEQIDELNRILTDDIDFIVLADKEKARVDKIEKKFREDQVKSKMASWILMSSGEEVNKIFEAKTQEAQIAEVKKLVQYIKTNYNVLRHSDKLYELVRGATTAPEVVDYKDFSDYQKHLNEVTKVLIEGLKDLVPPSEIMNAVVRQLIVRNLVNYAFDVTAAFPQYSYPKITEPFATQFRLKEESEIKDFSNDKSYKMSELAPKYILWVQSGMNDLIPATQAIRVLPQIPKTPSLLTIFNINVKEQGFPYNYVRLTQEPIYSVYSEELPKYPFIITDAEGNVLAKPKDVQEVLQYISILNIR